MLIIIELLLFLCHFLPGVHGILGDIEPHENTEGGFVVFRGAPCKRTSQMSLLNQMGIDFDIKRMGLKAPLRKTDGMFRTNGKYKQSHRRAAKKLWLKMRSDREGIYWKIEQNTEDRNEIVTKFWPSKLRKPHGITRFPFSLDQNQQSNEFLVEKRSEGEAQVDVGRLPWKCDLEQQWQRMPDGIFPPYIQTGRCTQTTCMLDTYACTPVKYMLKVLRRNPQVCNPLPMTGNETVYEEVWHFSRIKVTICCECSRLRPGYTPATVT